MKNTDNLNKFGTLIGASASSSDIATIPDAQATAGDGTASIALAFPPETFIPREAGGEPPRGQDMNGFLNLISSAIQPLQAGYLGPFDAAFAESIGGYPRGAIVTGSSVGTFWVSTSDNNTTVPGEDGASWQSLFTGLQAALGFTPVQQGGGPNQTDDKVCIGPDSTGIGGTRLAISIDGVLTDQGYILRSYAPDSTAGDVALTNIYYAGGVEHVWAAISDTIYGSLAWLTDLENKVSNNNAGSAALVISDIAGNSDGDGVHVWGPQFAAITLPSSVTVTAQVNAVQENLTAAVAAQADTNATVQTDLENKVSNNNAGSAALVISDIAGNSDGDGVHVWGAQFTAITLPSSVTVTAQVNAVQENLTAAVAAQADTNATVQTDLENKVSNNHAASGQDVISDIAGNSDGSLAAWGPDFTEQKYLPSALTINGATSVTQIGALVLQTLEVTLAPNGSNGAVTATVTLPQALTTGVLFAKGNALNGTQSDGSLRPSVNVLPASLTQVTVIADNLRGIGWGESVTIQLLVMGS